MLSKLCRYTLALSLTVQCSFLISTQSFADDQTTIQSIVKPFTATYSILRKSDKVGTGVRQLKYLTDDSAIYSYKTDIEWFIFSDSRSEVSEIKLINNKIIPSHYVYNREGTGRDKNYEWQYNANENTGYDVKKSKTVALDFSSQIQDPLSYHFQHRINLINNPKQTHFVYSVVKNSGSIKNYVYQYDGEEELMLPYGLVKTIRLKREVVEKKRITYAWFAPELNYLLVKLYQTKAGVEQFEAQLSHLENE